MNRGSGKRSEGGSSSWNAVSTVRRMKNVVNVRNGVSRRLLIFVAREEVEITGGRVSGGGGGGVSVVDAVKGIFSASW